jgi:hypothetical protein
MIITPTPLSRLRSEKKFSGSSTGFLEALHIHRPEE